MFFLNPTYLWALLGLAIPIAIHLWSKKEGKTIKIGSIQLLNEADSKQNSSIKLNELLLLFIRLIIISLVVFIMAEPQIKNEFKNTKLTYLIEPSLVNNKAIKSLIDTLNNETSIKLLKKGFPKLELDYKPISNDAVSNYWQIAQEMSQLHSDSIIVFSKGFLKSLKGKRPEINTNVKWIVLDENDAFEQIIQATKINNKVETISSVSNSQSLSFKKENITLIDKNETNDSIKIKNTWYFLNESRSIKILIIQEKKYEKEARFIDAAFTTISKFINRAIQVDKITNDSTDFNVANYDCLVWLRDKEPIQFSKKILMIHPNEFADSLIEQKTNSNVYHLTKLLDTETIIDEHLSEQLIKMLDFHSDLNEIISKNDNRIVSKYELNTNNNKNNQQKKYANVLNITKWLWLFLAGFLITERIVANYRKQ